MRKRVKLIWYVAAGLMGLICGCSGPERDGGNFLLITMDTVRADHMSVYGYEKETTPALKELAGGGILFENAVVPMPETDPSHISLMTSRYPHFHGVVKNAYPLRESETTLAEILSDAGYHTAAFVSVEHLATEGYWQGFREFNQVLEGHARLSRDVTPQVLEWLEENKNKRFFLWVHLWDPHFPYIDMSGNGEKSAIDLWMVFEQLQKKEVKLQDALADLNDKESEQIKAWLELSKDEMKQKFRELISDPQNVRKLIDNYDAEILELDRQIGEIIDYLRKSGLISRTLVTVTADHGETLDRKIDGSEYMFDHGELLFDSEIIVPLIMHMPGKIPAGERFSGMVSNLDVMPTALHLLNVKTENEYQGRNLMQIINDEHCKENYLFSATNPPLLECIRSDEWKLVFNIENGAYELFDLTSDAEENTDVSRERPRIVQSFAKKLKAWLEMKGKIEITPYEFDEDTKRMLEALGYAE